MYKNIYQIENIIEENIIQKKEEEKDEMNGMSRKIDKNCSYIIEEDTGQIILTLKTDEFNELWLHAYKYAVGNTIYKTKLPDWVFA